jgi:hypothetical protein
MLYNKKQYVIAKYRFLRAERRYKRHPHPKNRAALSLAVKLFTVQIDARIRSENGHAMNREAA